MLSAPCVIWRFDWPMRQKCATNATCIAPRDKLRIATTTKLWRSSPLRISTRRHSSVPRRASAAIPRRIVPSVARSVSHQFKRPGTDNYLQSLRNTWYVVQDTYIRLRSLTKSAVSRRSLLFSRRRCRLESITERWISGTQEPLWAHRLVRYSRQQLHESKGGMAIRQIEKTVHRSLRFHRVLEGRLYLANKDQLVRGTTADRTS